MTTVAVEIPVINQSQVKSWRNCQQEWDYHYRQKLIRKRKDRPMHLGSWVHRALQSHYVEGDWRIGHAIYKADYDQLFDEEKQYLDRGPEPLPKQVERIMRSYLWYWRNDHWQIVAVEQEFELDLPAIEVNGEAFPAWTFKGRIDLIVRDSDGTLWIVDHKTTSQIPERGAFHAMDPQLILYPWAAERALNIDTAGVIYNYVRSVAPTRPKLNKDGSVSKQKITTDYPTVVNFIREHNQNVADYSDFLAPLRDESEYLARYYLPKSEVVTNQVVTETLFTAREIIQHSTVTRNVTRDCERCPYMALCRAELFGLDASFLRGMDYTVETDSEGKEDDDGTGIDA